MDNPENRFHVIRYTITLVHELEFKEGDPEFFYCDHFCFGNVVNDLHAAESVDQEAHVCNICAAETAEYMGSFPTIDAAVESGWSHTPKTTPYDLSVERRKAHVQELYPETQTNKETD